MPLTRQRSELHRHHPITGRWVTVVGERDGVGRGCVRVEVGTTGNRLDPDRRVRRTGLDLVRAAGRLQLRSWWPVREVLTPGIGQFVADLHGQLEAAGSPDLGDDLATVDGIVAQVFGDDAGFGGPAGAPADLAARAIRAAYPLLTTPVERGARPDNVPIALEALLRHTDVRAAAQATLRPRATRPLVRALASSLLPDARGRIVWEPLELAVMAAQRCGPEHLTSVLETRAARPGAVTFSVAEIDRARAMFAEMHPRGVAETLRDALASPDGTTRLARRLTEWDARPPAPPPPPPGVETLPPRRTTAPDIDPGTIQLEYPAGWRVVEGKPVAGHVVVLPRTGNELLEWGAAMDNCLGGYRHAVPTGRTRIMGFTRDGRLELAVEVSRERVLRQLETVGNRRPSATLAATIVGFLRHHRLIDADARTR